MDLGNQREVEQRNKALKGERAKDDEAFRWLMADERGRRYAARLLRESEALVPRVAATPDRALFLEGMRAHGLGLIQQINRLCPQYLAAVIAASQATPAIHTGEDDGDRNA